MKKIITSALCLAMVFSTSISAFATNNSMQIRYSNQESYEIYIPDSMDLDASSGKGMFTIEVDETEMSENSYISVTATSENYDNGWFLVNVDDENDKIEYFIGTTDNGNDVTANNEIMAADGNTSVSFYITLSDTNKFGTYEDTVTFSSEIKETVKLINFTIEGESFQAVEGMNWRDWLDSIYCPEYIFAEYGEILYRLSDGTTRQINVMAMFGITENGEYVFM